jgi:hypothetical protein
MSKADGGWFHDWVNSGKLITAGWVVVLIIYCTFKAKGIDDPALGNVFFAVTGGWVGFLTLLQGKKTARTEQKVERLEQKAKENE